jgi:sortase A
MKRRAARLLGWLLLTGGSLMSVQALYPLGKGWFAMRLIEDAYARQPGSRPWPQADFRGVARLAVPRLGIDQVVLDQTTPRALAFGPGLAHRRRGAGPIVSGHRDTHFRWVAGLERGDELFYEQAGTRRRYRIAAFRVVDGERQRLALPDADTLLLTTCWPLDALAAGGSLRYVVTAIAMPEAST